MNIFQLYLELLKGTATAFAGLASLPVIHESLVVQHHVLTDAQLNEAVVITRSTPGPVGLWVVSAGYSAAGVPGAIAGWFAMITPAVLIIPMLRFAHGRIEHPRVRAMLQAVVIASAGLLLAAAIPLAREAVTDPLTLGIAAVALAVMLATKIEVAWVLLAAAIVSTGGAAAKLILG